MELGRPRKDRLEELLALAQAYRGWSLRQLAAELGRDPHTLVPESGVPKIDLVVGLAKVLDWSVEDVVKDLYGETGRKEPGAAELSFNELDRSAYLAYQEGRHADAVALARRAYGVAASGDDRARACLREYGGWDGQGRYLQAIEAAQRGLRESGVSFLNELFLQVNLANSHYLLGNLHEGSALASMVLELFAGPEVPKEAEEARGFALYVRGSCHRVLAGAKAERREFHARRALDDLSLAASVLRREGGRRKAASSLGTATTCEGGILEMQAMLGELPAADALAQIEAALEAAVQIDDGPQGPALESLGWWCIFGCNIAMRHLRDEQQVERLLGILTNKADEIAGRLGNWALREHVWSLELARRQLLEKAGIPAEEWVLDSDDTRLVAGTMGRFPVFRETGWQVLRTSRLVKD